LLANRIEYEQEKGELDELKSKTLLKLLEKQHAKKLGLYSSPPNAELVVTYSVNIPQSNETFYFFLSPTDIDFHILPTIEGDFRNPNPKYIPSIDFATNSLKKFLSEKTINQSKKKSKKIRKGGPKLKRSVFVSSYLDGRPQFKLR